MYVPSEVILVAPYIFLYTSGTVAVTVLGTSGVMVLVLLFEQANNAMAINVGRIVFFIFMLFSFLSVIGMISFTFHLLIKYVYFHFLIL
jgi:hypothetical protein